LDLRGEFLSVYSDEQFRAMWTIGLSKGNGLCLAVAWLHSQYCLLKARDHVSLAQGKCKWVTLLRGVKRRAVGESAGIMDVDSIPELCLSHNGLPYHHKERRVRRGGRKDIPGGKPQSQQSASVFRLMITNYASSVNGTR
jgi:hypothetical protein